MSIFLLINVLLLLFYGNEILAQDKPLLLKCQCKANQVLTGNHCTDSPTKISVYDFVKKDSIPIQTTDFGEILVKDLNCGEGMHVAELNESDFFILSNGSLIDIINYRIFSAGNFCVEHVSHGEGMQIVSKICYSNITLSQCCPPNHILNEQLECDNYTKKFDFAPPFIGGKSLKNLTGNVELVQCRPGYNLNVVNISDSNSIYFLSVSNKNEAVLQNYLKNFEVNQILEPSNFCVGARNTQDSIYYEVLFCKIDRRLVIEKTCSRVPCSRKCCPVGYVFNYEYRSCYRPNKNLTLPIITEAQQQDGDSESPTRHIITGAPFCDSYDVVDYEDDMNKPILFRNGSLLLPKLSIQFDLDKYCVETVEDGRYYVNKAFVCFEHIEYTSCGWRYTVTSAMLGISSLFLIATFVVYVSDKGLRSRMSGKCLISEVSALIAGYIALIVIQTSQDDLSHLGCRIAGNIVHVFILASFFWLNVMCYDMWATIRSNRPMEEASTTKRYIFYSIYGWGSPVFVGLVTILADSLPVASDNLLRPGIGQRSCFFADPKSQWAYLYSVIAVLLLVNLCFFMHTVYTLWKAQRDNERIFTGHSRTAGGNVSEHHQRFWMYGKLFVVMGICWAAEVISFHVETNTYSSCFYWLPTDIINGLRGIFIFAIFVCKKTTLKKIKSSCKSKYVLSHFSSSEGKTRTSNLSSVDGSADRKVVLQSIGMKKSKQSQQVSTAKI